MYCRWVSEWINYYLNELMSGWQNICKFMHEEIRWNENESESETKRALLIVKCTCCLNVAGYNYFYAGTPITRPIWRGGQWNSWLLKGAETFWAPFKWPLAKIETFRGGWDFFGHLNGTSDSEGHFGANNWQKLPANLAQIQPQGEKSTQYSVHTFSWPLLSFVAESSVQPVAPNQEKPLPHLYINISLDNTKEGHKPVWTPPPGISCAALPPPACPQSSSVRWRPRTLWPWPSAPADGWAPAVGTGPGLPAHQGIQGSS